MNRQLSKDVFETGKFMTLFYLSIDEGRRSLEWVRAGHDPAWVYDSAEDSFEELKGEGIALGVDEAFAYRSHKKSSLKKGQVIILGTDGLWEGRNKSGEMFGKNRLQRIIRQNAAFGAEIILNAVFEEHHRFTLDERAEDDLTLVILKVTQ
jgi:sigma-B regulation protein RsbU (phosphoserine phosphatase)